MAWCREAQLGGFRDVSRYPLSTNLLQCNVAGPGTTALFRPLGCCPATGGGFSPFFVFFIGRGMFAGGFWTIFGGICGMFSGIIVDIDKTYHLSSSKTLSAKSPKSSGGCLPFTAALPWLLCLRISIRPPGLGKHSVVGISSNHGMIRTPVLGLAFCSAYIFFLAKTLLY